MLSFVLMFVIICDLTHLPCHLAVTCHNCHNATTMVRVSAGLNPGLGWAEPSAGLAGSWELSWCLLGGWLLALLTAALAASARAYNRSKIRRCIICHARA